MRINPSVGIIVAIILGRILFVATIGDTNLTNSDPLTLTNRGINVLELTTNNVVKAFGKEIGRLDGSNYVAVPDLAALNAAHENAFALGVRYGAIATRRNPDLSELNALIAIAKQLLASDAAKQAHK